MIIKIIGKVLGDQLANRDDCMVNNENVNHIDVEEASFIRDIASEMNERNENDNSENESSKEVVAEEATHENIPIYVVKNAVEVENIEHSEKTCEVHVQRDNIEVENEGEEVIENTVSHQTSTANATPDVIPVYLAKHKHSKKM